MTLRLAYRWSRTGLFTCILAGMLWGCGRDVRTEPLSAYDLTSRDVVNEVLKALPQRDRGPFMTYTIHHLASSRFFCGDVLVDRSGRQPATIGDAIQMTVAREKERFGPRPLVDPATLDEVTRYRLQLAAKLKEREHLVDRRDMVSMTGDGGPTQAARLRELDAQIARSAQEIATLRASAPPGAELPRR